MKNGEPKENQLGEIRKEHARKIVRSVLTEGVMSAEAQVARGNKPLRSMDNFPFLCGHFAFPPGYVFEKLPLTASPSEQTVTANINGYIYTEAVPAEESIDSYLLEKALYGEERGSKSLSYAILPILVERNNENYQYWTKAVTEERMQNSIVVVVPVSQIHQADHILPKYPSDIRLNPTVTLTPTAVLIPEGLRSDLEDVVAKDGRNIQFIGNITRPILRPVVDQNLTIPDYMGGLQALLAPINEPVFIHGIRLPTVEDVASGRIG